MLVDLKTQKPQFGKNLTPIWIVQLLIKKVFEFKMDVFGKDRTIEEVFKAITELVESKEDADEAWNGKYITSAPKLAMDT